MNNPWDEIELAIRTTREVNGACNKNANSMAGLLTGRLRHVSTWTLKKLKRELRDFNIHTGKWK